MNYTTIFLLGFLGYLAISSVFMAILSFSQKIDSEAGPASAPGDVES